LPLTTDHIRVYPVPAKDVIFLEFSDNIMGQIQIRDLFGQLHIQKGIHGSLQRNEIDLIGLAQGLYLLILQDPTGQAFIRKILKR
jgi:hypothetical protein